MMAGYAPRLKWVVGLLAMLLAGAGNAAERIEVVKLEGAVSVNKPAGGKQAAVSKKRALPASNVLVTGDNGRAVVRVGSTGYLVLGNNSKVEMAVGKDNAAVFRHLTGVIYYAVNKITRANQKYEVRTKLATIGVRGTRFLVTEVPERSEIGMRKGAVDVTSLDETFEIHRQSGQDEFEAFKRKHEEAVKSEQADFDAYKTRIQGEFVEFKQALSLGADRMLSFDGRRVDERPLGGVTKDEMESLERYAGEWINKVND